MPIIKVENLGKRYFLWHLSQSRGTLRDAITEKAKDLFGKLKKRETSQTKREDFWALKDVNFEVNQGDRVGIIGRNGAGKSTLLKILSRITEPTTGRILMNGRAASLLEVGTGFHPELSGRENIFLNGAILGMNRSEIQRKFDEIVDFAEIRQFIDTPVKRYSSGMYVRLAFAVAAHLEPDILMVDEVLAVGDVAFQKKCLGKMKDVSSTEGRTILLVSHQMGAIQQLCNKCMFIEKGSILEYSDDVNHAVKNYVMMFSQKQQKSDWINSGIEYDNPFMKPLKFYFGDEQENSVEMPVLNNTDIYVYIEFELKQIDLAFNIGFGVINEEGSSIFWSFIKDPEELSWLKLKLGINKIRARFPKNFLNEGTYIVELLAGLYHRDWIIPQSAGPTINLEIKGGLSDSPYWIEKRSGICAPVLNWESF